MATADSLGHRASTDKAEPHFGRTVVYQGEVLRHNVYTRVVHWGVALFFTLALLSGFAIFSPWLYKWISPLFGGGPMARLLHPWFGIGFVVVLLLQLRGWSQSMRVNDNDRAWLKRIKAYVTNEEKSEPETVGKFNGGQKLWFWTTIVSGIIFLISGIPLWFPETLGRTLMWICYFFHDLAGLVMLGGFFVHIYEGTAAIPGTFQSMIRGTVSNAWAWTHHPGWYREVTGRDAKTDRDEAIRKQPRT